MTMPLDGWQQDLLARLADHSASMPERDGWITADLLQRSYIERYDDPARPWPSVMKIARQLAVLARAGHCERREGATSSYRIQPARREP